MKKALIKFSLILIVFALLAVISTAVFVCSGVAYAAEDDTVEVIKATVSNLEGNATAVKSAVYVYFGSDKVYIPESYFLKVDKLNDYTAQGGAYAYDFTYCSKPCSLYVTEKLTVSNISLSEDELLFPDVRLTLKEGVVITKNNTEITNDYTIKFIGYGEDANQIYVNATLNGNSIPTFVSVDDVEPFSIPYQKQTQAERDALLAAKEEPKLPFIGELKPNTSTALRVIIIIGIAIPAVLIVLLLFKPSKNERRYAKNTVRSSRSRDDIDYDDSRSYRRRDDRRDDRDYDRRDSRDYDRRDDRDYDDRYYGRRDDRDYDRRDDRR